MRISVVIVCALTSSPAWAWQEPKAVSPVSPICTVPYNANEGVMISTAPGNTLTIELGDTRAIKEVAVSDLAHLKRSTTGNVLWLKPTDAMAPQPISVRAVRDDGKAELYILQWSAENDKRGCDLVRFTYPSDAADKARADAAKRREEWQAGQASRDLRNASRLPTAGSTLNRSYTISGDADLMPRQFAPIGSTAATQIGALR